MYSPICVCSVLIGKKTFCVGKHATIVNNIYAIIFALLHEKIVVGGVSLSILCDESILVIRPAAVLLQMETKTVCQRVVVITSG